MYPKALFSEQKIRRVSVKKQQIQKIKYKCELKEMNKYYFQIGNRIIDLLCKKIINIRDVDLRLYTKKIQVQEYNKK